MKLLRDFIVIRPDDEDDNERVSAGGIVLPGAQPSQFATGEVVQVGEYIPKSKDVLHIKYVDGEDILHVIVGDRVLYYKFQVQDFEIDGGETGLKLATENAVVAILSNAEDNS